MLHKVLTVQNCLDLNWQLHNAIFAAMTHALLQCQKKHSKPCVAKNSLKAAVSSFTNRKHVSNLADLASRPARLGRLGATTLHESLAKGRPGQKDMHASSSPGCLHVHRRSVSSASQVLGLTPPAHGQTWRITPHQFPSRSLRVHSASLLLVTSGHKETCL